MLPIVELRGAIPIGSLAFKIPWYWCYILSVIGNLVPIPFILIFIEKLIGWFKKTKHLKKLGLFLESKAEKNTARVQKYEVFGLMLFVAIPLPMTGAWTGALVAALTGMKFKNSMISIIGGVLIAGAIVTLICQGVLGFLSFLI
ncbi:MAG: small multi-drug export protein [Clostridia bacterium]|nr:small multi-drug export protein [Clostridia bacterium]